MTKTKLDSTNTKVNDKALFLSYLNPPEYSLNFILLCETQLTWPKPFIFAFLLFRAVPMAYGSSQARERIRATAASQATATVTWDLNHISDLHHSSQQHHIPNPLSKARDRTHIPMYTCGIHFHCTVTGTLKPFFSFFFFLWLLVTNLRVPFFLPVFRYNDIQHCISLRYTT